MKKAVSSTNRIIYLLIAGALLLVAVAIMVIAFNRVRNADKKDDTATELLSPDKPIDSSNSSNSDTSNSTQNQQPPTSTDPGTPQAPGLPSIELPTP